MVCACDSVLMLRSRGMCISILFVSVHPSPCYLGCQNIYIPCRTTVVSQAFKGQGYSSRLIQSSWLAWILLGIGIPEITTRREKDLIFLTLGFFLYCLFSSYCLFPLKSHSELPNLKCINQLSASGICQAVAVVWISYVCM